MVGIFNMNEDKLKQMIKKSAIEEEKNVSDEINNRRAELFAKTILNARKVAEYNFEQDMQKYKIEKDKTSELVKLMTLRGKQKDIQDSRREELLQQNQIPKGKVLEKNEELTKILRDTQKSFSHIISDDNFTDETQKMGELLHQSQEMNDILPGEGVQTLTQTHNQRLKLDAQLFKNGFQETKNKRKKPRTLLQRNVAN